MIPIRIRNVDVYPYRDMQHLLDNVCNKKKLILSLNAEIIMKAEGSISDIINRNIGYADGFGTVLALRQKGVKNVARIPGCELWLKFIEEYHDRKTFYLIGATEDIIKLTVEKLRNSYPAIDIVGYRNGYIKTKEERQELIEDVKQKQPDFVFVAMGFPVQEYLMTDLYVVHPAIYLNLGGSFDVFTGKVSRAPYWIQKIGMEWFYRFATHPSRYKRQIVYLRFFWAYCCKNL